MKKSALFSRSIIGLLSQNGESANLQKLPSLFVDYVMRKLATKTIATETLVPKRMTLPSSVEHFCGWINFANLIFSVSKLTFVPVWTEAHFREIFAHLSFVFVLIYSLSFFV